MKDDFVLEVRPTKTDSRGKTLYDDLKDRFPLTSVQSGQVFTFSKKFTSDQKEKIQTLLTNPVAEISAENFENAPDSFDWAIEIGFLPGVTDNLSATVEETVEDGLKMKFENEEAVFSAEILYLSGSLSREDVRTIAHSLHNPLIQRARIKSFVEFQSDDGLEAVIPKVLIDHAPKADTVDLNVSDETLIEIGKKGIKNPDGSFRGPLALSLNYMRTIQAYFKKEGRNPTDVELESLAQTWSEHCRHTIFANPIDEISAGIFRHYIRRATQDIREAKGADDFCVSVFSDNAGGIVFDEKWAVSDKMETHNSPSALDPYGGAMTGIVGVNRDTLGFGVGARPVLNRFGFCTGDPQKQIEIFRGKNRTNPALQPRTILDGVVAGVEAGGNQSGIPTPQGFVYFDEGYEGKPLVFAGTVGLIPRTVAGKNSAEKKAEPGDHIVMAGGKIGMDGIHGATFSSESLDESSPATAVQIGDPITQKKMIDAIVYELRDHGYIRSVHDCGAGGISCTVGELGTEAGGFEVQLETAPLKYPNLSPWEIWISESQERMVFSIPPEKSAEFVQKLTDRGIEANVIGTFTDSGRGVVKYHGDTVFDLDLDFLEDGWPKEQLKTKPFPVPKFTTPESLKLSDDFSADLLSILSANNVAGFQYISEQYDHIVQGGAVIGPLQGSGKVNGSAAVTRPVLNSKKAIVTSQALNPKLSDIDSYDMALCTIDDAVAAAVAVGADVDHMAIMDNFCWCSSNESERLHQLKEAAKGCYDLAVAYGTPYISGKDSMFNDFQGFDAENNPIKISVPPTLLLSTLSVIPEAEKVQTMDFKVSGDLIYVIGETEEGLAGSEYQWFLQRKNILEKGVNLSRMPKFSAENSLDRYRRIFQAHQSDLFASIQHIHRGGIVTALAKSCIAGALGCAVQKSTKNVSDLAWLFAESRSRFLVSINPANRSEFESRFPDAYLIGTVTDTEELKIENLLTKNISDLADSYNAPFANY